MRYQTHLLRKYYIYLKKISGRQLTKSERENYRARIFDIKRQLQAINTEDMTATGFEYFRECSDLIAELEAYYG